MDSTKGDFSDEGPIDVMTTAKEFSQRAHVSLISAHKVCAQPRAAEPSLCPPATAPVPLRVSVKTPALGNTTSVSHPDADVIADGVGHEEDSDEDSWNSPTSTVSPTGSLFTRGSYSGEESGDEEPQGKGEPKEGLSHSPTACVNSSVHEESGDEEQPQRKEPKEGLSHSATACVNSSVHEESGDEEQPQRKEPKEGLSHSATACNSTVLYSTVHEGREYRENCSGPLLNRGPEPYSVEPGLLLPSACRGSEESRDDGRQGPLGAVPAEANCHRIGQDRGGEWEGDRALSAEDREVMELQERCLALLQSCQSPHTHFRRTLGQLRQSQRALGEANRAWQAACERAATLGF